MNHINFGVQILNRHEATILNQFPQKKRVPKKKKENNSWIVISPFPMLQDLKKDWMNKTS
jgi:hypothetical protein